MSADDLSLRREVIEACRELTRRGLVHGTSGNVSVRRDARHFFVSPTGLGYGALEPADVPLMDLHGRWFGRHRPSSEWRLHRDILAVRGDIGAVVHTHSPRATGLAATGRGIPAFHYMVATAGGVDIRCAPYHAFGSQELADAALAALEGRRACLLANHGVIALGAELRSALDLATEVENLADQYCTALLLGKVSLLDDTKMQAVLEKFRTYGKPEAPDAELIAGGPTLPPLVGRS